MAGPAVTPTSAVLLDVYRVVCGTNLLMFCESVEPSVRTVVSSTCASAHAANASKAKAATAVLLAILACLCRQHSVTERPETHPRWRPVSKAFGVHALDV